MILPLIVIVSVIADQNTISQFAVNVQVIVVAGVIVTIPVDTDPIPIVPVPFAFIVRFVAAQESVVTIATVPQVAAPVIFNQAACEAVEASTTNAGLVAPANPTAKAEAQAEVIVVAEAILSQVSATISKYQSAPEFK
jgi:hypothetical protein